MGVGRDYRARARPQLLPDTRTTISELHTPRYPLAPTAVSELDDLKPQGFGLKENNPQHPKYLLVHDHYTPPSQWRPRIQMPSKKLRAHTGGRLEKPWSNECPGEFRHFLRCAFGPGAYMPPPLQSSGSYVPRPNSTVKASGLK